MGKLRDALSVKPKDTEKIKVGIWGFIGGAIVAMVIGFNWGGWETSSATLRLNDKAVLANQAGICVAQFKAGPGYKEKLAELQKLESWSRSGFIEKGGWDKMPGQKDASSGVASECVTGIEALIKI